MKKTSYLAVAAAILLSACSSDETTQPGVQESGMARFTGSIEGAVTRASNTAWDAGDLIGITGTSGTEDYTNVPYMTATASGSFEAQGMAIYYNTPDEVNFTAYYPWKTELTDATEYSFNTDAQSGQKGFDFLYATGTGSKDEPEVDFTFSHCMSKVALTVKAGADVSYSEVESAVCSFSNFLNNATFNRATGVVAATGEPVAADKAWTFANGTDETTDITTDGSSSVTYGLILVPQAFENGNLAFTASVQTADATAPQVFTVEIDLSQVPDNGNENRLRPGYQYNITVNVNKTGLTVGDCNISPWKTVSYSTDATM